MKTIIVWTAALVALTTLAFAAVPLTINYQGYLKNTTTGVPASGSVSMTFSLYSSNPARNNPVWGEMQPKVPVTNGVYNMQRCKPPTRRQVVRPVCSRSTIMQAIPQPCWPPLTAPARAFSAKIPAPGAPGAFGFLTLTTALPPCLPRQTAAGMRENS